MSKIIENFRLEEHQREILKMRTAALGITKSQYLRSLIDKDNLGNFRKPANNLYEEWKVIRSEIMLSDTKKALLAALKKEFEDIDDHKGKKVTTFDGICRKYGLDRRNATSDLKDLMRLNIFTSDKARNYAWTLEGIMIIPEYALALSNGKFLFSGDMAYLLNLILGEYNKVLEYFAKKIGTTEEESNFTFEIVLAEHIRFITWLRDVSYSYSGIADPEDILYYRKQMIHFLFNYLMMIKENQTVMDIPTNLRNKLIVLLANYLSKSEDMQN